SATAKQYPTSRHLRPRAAAGLAPERIAANVPDQPLVQAEILNTVGDTYRGAGKYREAIAHLLRSRALREARLGPDHPDTLATLNNLAEAYHDAGQLPEAI